MAPVFLILLVFLNLWAFPMDQWAWITAYIVFLVYLISVLVRKEELFKKLVIGSVVLISFTNFILHTNFYPKLIKYQSGSELAYAVHEQNIPIENIYFLETFSRSFDFYAESFIREISIEQLANENIGREIWVFTYEEGIEKLRNAGIVWEKEIKAEHFRITNFNAQFLNPETRSESLTNAYILKIR
jgi:hypothetical protein